MTMRRFLPLLLCFGLAGCAKHAARPVAEAPAVQEPPPQPPRPDHRAEDVAEATPPLATPLPEGTDPAARDEHVFFFETFEDDGFFKRFTEAYRPENFRSSTDSVLMGRRSLKVRYQDGSTFGGSLNYKFKQAGRAEPEELYGRYYLRFDQDFYTGDGGKLPGPAGTYGRAGWGDREATGHNGWSARMGFLHAGREQIQLTFYVYETHAGMSGVHYPWDISLRGRIQKGRWYCIETYVKLNTPGRGDGVLRGWVDGKIAFERSKYRFRMTDKLKIEEFWVNHYYGGMTPVPKQQHVYMDNVALSTHPIGPATGAR